MEIYAHQGRLRGGQVHKVARDALKLITIARNTQGATLHIAFASEAAKDSASRGWLGEALAIWAVNTRVVRIAEETRRQLEVAQQRQRMINPAGEDELSGDDAPTLSEDEL